MKNILSLYLSALALTSMVVACSPDEVTHPDASLEPKIEDVQLDITVDETNNVTFSMLNEGVPVWIFTDAKGKKTAFSYNDYTKKYPQHGTYSVQMLMYNANGCTQDTITKEFVVQNDFIMPSIVEGGDMSDASQWTKSIISGGVDVTFENGVASWKGGSWGHAAIFKKVDVEAKMYMVDLTVSGSGATDTWFEVYVSEKEPVVGKDYSEGGILMGLNTWDGCGKSPFEGKLSEVGCKTRDGGTITFTKAGSVYILIKGGGSYLGDSGINVDEVEMRPLE